MKSLSRKTKNILSIITIFVLVLATSESYAQFFQNSDKEVVKLLDSAWNNRGSKPYKSEKFARKALKIASENDDFSHIAQAYNYLGIVYRNIANYDSSYKMYLKALYYAKMGNDSTQIAYSYNNIGGYWGYKNRYFLAIKNISIARDYFKGKNDLVGVGFSDIQIGMWFRYLKDYENSLFYLNEALKIREQKNDSLGIAATLSQIADTYIALGNNKLADSLNFTAFVIYTKKKDIRGKAYTLSNMGYIQGKIGNYKRAGELLRGAVKFSSKIDNPLGLQRALSRLADIYMFENKMELAFESLKQAHANSKGNLTDEDLEILQKFLTYYEKTKEFARYVALSREYSRIVDSLDVNERKSQFDEFENLFQLTKVQQENEKLKEDLNYKERIVIFFVIMAVFVLILIGLIFYLNKRINKEKILLSEAITTKDKLFSIVAHDLKNPFSSLLGYSSLLLDEFEELDRTEIKNGLRNMRASTEKLLQMVDNLLQWARTQTDQIQYNPEVIVVDKIILSTISYYTQSAKAKDVELKIQFKPNLRCFCDKTMFETALRNLINNSIKFTRNGGRISIHSEIDETQEFVKIIVEDNGVGIEKSKLNNLFSNNSSSDGTLGEKGTGLGLPLVKEMVEKNGGTISVESEVGQGTSFIFTIPRVE